jgi:hypothetical protein
MPEKSAFPAQGLYERFVDALKLAGVHRIEIEFDGSGDSGDINDVLFFNKNDANIDVSSIVVPWVSSQTKFNHETRQWDTTTDEVEVDLVNVTKDAFYDLVNAYNYDWYNNDGGFGTLKMEFNDEGTELLMEVEFNIRYTEVNSYSHIANLAQVSRGETSIED